jgi:hypothetical protein
MKTAAELRTGRGARDWQVCPLHADAARGSSQTRCPRRYCSPKREQYPPRPRRPWRRVDHIIAPAAIIGCLLRDHGQPGRLRGFGPTLCSAHIPPKRYAGYASRSKASLLSRQALSACARPSFILCTSVWSWYRRAVQDGRPGSRSYFGAPVGTCPHRTARAVPATRRSRRRQP